MKTKNKRNPVPLALSVSASCPPDGEEIARRAYVLWEQEGCPAGRDLDYWLKAEAELGQGRERLSQFRADNAERALHAPVELAAVGCVSTETMQAFEEKEFSAIAGR